MSCYSMLGWMGLDLIGLDCIVFMWLVVLLCFVLVCVVLERDRRDGMTCIVNSMIRV